ncbi:hypothetical protein [Nocardia sp. GAS34]|uniref:hypothetical protein n=1 Tax=unclassified Nocardia TaxID=2637762 RepID=UPI003D19AC37
MSWKELCGSGKTKLEHAWEIQRECGLVSFGLVEAELSVWIADQSWMTGDGPKAIFAGAPAVPARAARVSAGGAGRDGEGADRTVYSDRAVEQLRAQDHPVREHDAARLSAFARGHIGLDGHYAFRPPDLGGTHRPLRDPDARDDG